MYEPIAAVNCRTSAKQTSSSRSTCAERMPYTPSVSEAHLPLSVFEYAPKEDRIPRFLYVAEMWATTRGRNHTAQSTLQHSLDTVRRQYGDDALSYRFCNWKIASSSDWPPRTRAGLIATKNRRKHCSFRCSLVHDENGSSAIKVDVLAVRDYAPAHKSQYSSPAIGSTIFLESQDTQAIEKLCHDFLSEPVARRWGLEYGLENHSNVVYRPYVLPGTRKLTNRAHLTPPGSLVSTSLSAMNPPPLAASRQWHSRMTELGTESDKRVILLNQSLFDAASIDPDMRIQCAANLAEALLSSEEPVDAKKVVQNRLIGWLPTQGRKKPNDGGFRARNVYATYRTGITTLEKVGVDRNRIVGRPGGHSMIFSQLENHQGTSLSPSGVQRQAILESLRSGQTSRENDKRIDQVVFTAQSEDEFLSQYRGLINQWETRLGYNETQTMTPMVW